MFERVAITKMTGLLLSHYNVNINTMYQVHVHNSLNI